MTDKHGILQNLNNGKSIVLDLGCGALKKDPSWIGIDALDLDNVDIVGDIFEVLAAFPASSVDEIHSSHFFEHIADLEKLVSATARVLKPGAKMIVTTPHFANPYFYSDYTHKTSFGLYTFSYLADERLFKRKVPKYISDVQFTLTKVKLRFQSPFRIRNWLYRFYGSIINLSYYLKEMYEENWSRAVYCYEIVYELQKKTPA